MVAPVLCPQVSAAADQAARDRFVSMLPAIRRIAYFAFKGRAAEVRQELVAEVVANAWVAYWRLVERGRAELAYPSPLAQYGVRQVLDGRRVGCRLNRCDTTSSYCQARTNVRVQSLRERDEVTGRWRDIAVEDGRATPAEVAALRIDFADWLRKLPRQKRRMAQVLATGESTQDVARQFDVSSARVSQLRNELRANWETFHGEPALA